MFLLYSLKVLYFNYVLEYSQQYENNFSSIKKSLSHYRIYVNISERFLSAEDIRET